MLKCRPARNYSSSVFYIACLCRRECQFKSHLSMNSIYSLPRDKLRYRANWMQIDKKERCAWACIAWAAKSATLFQQTACWILHPEFYVCTWGVQRCLGTGKLKGDLFGLVTLAGQCKKLRISLKFKATGGLTPQGKHCLCNQSYCFMK